VPNVPPSICWFNVLFVNDLTGGTFLFLSVPEVPDVPVLPLVELLEHFELLFFKKCSGLKYSKSYYLVVPELMEHLERTF